MFENNVSDCLSLLKRQIDSQEMLLEYHEKIEAMFEMIFLIDVTDFPREKLHHYLCVMSDLLDKASELNRELLDTLLKGMLLLVVPENLT